MVENEVPEKKFDDKSLEQVECLNCGGQGYIWLSTYTGAWDMDTCPDCLGTGKIDAANHQPKINKSK